MHNIKTNITNTHFSHNRIEICAIVIKKRINFTKFFHNTWQMIFKDTESVRACHHKSSHVIGKSRFKSFRVNHTVFRGKVDNFISSHHCRCRVCTVGRIRNNNFCFFVTFISVIRCNKHNTSELTISTRHGLHSKGFHAVYFAKHFFHFINSLQGTLRIRFAPFKLWNKWVGRAKARKSRNTFVYFRVVLHGTRSKRI